jgi:hypothetical protein
LKPYLELSQSTAQEMHTLTELQQQEANCYLRLVMVKAITARIKELLRKEQSLAQDIARPEHEQGIIGHIARRALIECGSMFEQIQYCDEHPDHLKAGIVSVVEATHEKVNGVFERWVRGAREEYTPSIIDPEQQSPAVREYVSLLEHDFPTKTLPLFHTVRTAFWDVMHPSDLLGMEPGYTKEKRLPHTIQESYSIPFLRPKTIELLFDPVKGRDLFIDTTSSGVWTFDYFERQISEDGKINLPSVYESMLDGLSHPPANSCLASYKGRLLRGQDGSIFAWETHEQTPRMANSTQASRVRNYMANGATGGRMWYHGTPSFKEFESVLRQIQLFDTVVGHHPFAVDRLFALSFREMYRENPRLKYMVAYILHELHTNPPIPGMRGGEPIRFAQNVKSKGLWRGLGFDVFATDHNKFGPVSHRRVMAPGLEGEEPKEIDMSLNPEWGAYSAPMAKAVEGAEKRYRNVQLIHGDISYDSGQRPRNVA